MDSPIYKGASNLITVSLILSPCGYSSVESASEPIFQRLEGRSIQRDIQYRWPNAVVPYLIENTFNTVQRSVIASVSLHFDSESKIFFCSKIFCSLQKYLKSCDNIYLGKMVEHKQLH